MIRVVFMFVLGVSWFLGMGQGINLNQVVPVPVSIGSDVDRFLPVSMFIGEDDYRGWTSPADGYLNYISTDSLKILLGIVGAGGIYGGSDSIALDVEAIARSMFTIKLPTPIAYDIPGGSPFYIDTGIVNIHGTGSDITEGLLWITNSTTERPSLTSTINGMSIGANKIKAGWPLILAGASGSSTGQITVGGSLGSHDKSLLFNAEVALWQSALQFLNHDQTDGVDGQVWMRTIDGMDWSELDTAAINGLAGINMYNDDILLQYTKHLNFDSGLIGTNDGDFVDVNVDTALISTQYYASSIDTNGMFDPKSNTLDWKVTDFGIPTTAFGTITASSSFRIGTGATSYTSLTSIGGVPMIDFDHVATDGGTIYGANTGLTIDHLTKMVFQIGATDRLTLIPTFIKFDDYSNTRDDGALTNIAGFADASGAVGAYPLQTLIDSVGAHGNGGIFNIVNEGATSGIVGFTAKAASHFDITMSQDTRKFRVLGSTSGQDIELGESSSIGTTILLGGQGAGSANLSNFSFGGNEYFQFSHTDSFVLAANGSEIMESNGSLTNHNEPTYFLDDSLFAPNLTTALHDSIVAYDNTDGEFTAMPFVSSDINNDVTQGSDGGIFLEESGGSDTHVANAELTFDANHQTDLAGFDFDFINGASDYVLQLDGTNDHVFINQGAGTITNPQQGALAIKADNTAAWGTALALEGVVSTKSNRLTMHTANSSASFSNMLSTFMSRGSVASPTNSSANDRPFLFNGFGYHTSSYRQIANMEFRTGSGWGSGNYHGKVLFQTTADGGTTVGARFTLDGDDVIWNDFTASAKDIVETELLGVDASGKMGTADIADYLGGEWTLVSTTLNPNAATTDVVIGGTAANGKLHVTEASGDTKVRISTVGAGTADEVHLQLYDGSSDHADIIFEQQTNEAELTLWVQSEIVMVLQEDATNFSASDARIQTDAGIQNKNWIDVSATLTLDKGHYGIWVTTSAITVNLPAATTALDYRGQEYFIVNKSGGDITVDQGDNIGTCGSSADCIDDSVTVITLSDGEKLHITLAQTDVGGNNQWYTH